MTTVIRGTDNSVSAPAVSGSDGDTGLYFPAANQVALATNGTQAIFIDSSQKVGVGTSAPDALFQVQGSGQNLIYVRDTSAYSAGVNGGGILFQGLDSGSTNRSLSVVQGISDGSNGGGLVFQTRASGSLVERARFPSDGRFFIGATAAHGDEKLLVNGNAGSGTGDGTLTLRRNSNASNGDGLGIINFADTRTSSIYARIQGIADGTTGTNDFPGALAFYTTKDGGSSTTEAGRFDALQSFLVGTTNNNPAENNVPGFSVYVGGTPSVSGARLFMTSVDNEICRFNRKTTDGQLLIFHQDGTQEGNISVSGNTVSYNAFTGGHWSQLQEGRGYNPFIPRGTVMSTIGDMSEWKSAVWDEVIEHPAIEIKEAWSETITHRKDYFGSLPIGSTFEEDGVIKTVVDDGNERLPKVKISDVVGDKAVYGVFQTWDESQDMLVTSLGAFVVRIAAGVTVQIGDLLESNGDGCAKVQDDDVIRSKTIGKVTSTTPTATYDDGSYTVPCVIYCG